MKRQKRFPKMYGVMISQEVQESLLLLKNQGFDTADLCRQGISKAVSDALRKIKAG